VKETDKKSLKLKESLKKICLVVPFLVFIFWSLKNGNFFQALVPSAFLLFYFYTLWKGKYGSEEYKRRCGEFYYSEMKKNWKDRVGSGYGLFMARMISLGIIFLILLIKFLWESL
jgi:hypothetical protein